MRLRYLLAVYAGLAVSVSVAFAQSSEQQPVETTPPASAVFELIQNSRALRETYLLNRYTGDSWQLVRSTKRYVWQSISREAHERDVLPENWFGPAYQVSVSGLAAKGTYMINVITGATWILFEDTKDGHLFWGAIPAPK